MARRPLTRDERALWRLVTRGIDPLRTVPEEADPAPPAPPPPPAPPVQATPPSAAPRPRVPAPPPLAPVEARLLRRVRRGSHEVEGVLDLHGMRQAEAHLALRGFLRAMQARGALLVVVVTGKGGAPGGASTGDGGDERGVLRRVVPHWLAGPELRPIVLGFEAAGPRHGGGGALYVRLRRAGGAAWTART